MISQNSNFTQSSNTNSTNIRIEYLRGIMEEFIGEDSTSNIFISVYNGNIKTHDEFFVAIKYFGSLTPTEKINKKFDITYIGKYIFPNHIFEELQCGIIDSNNKSSLQEKVEKSKSRRRKLFEKIFWNIDDDE